jgi:hypothetical protein
MSVLPVGIGSEEGGYQIERSLRFNSPDSAHLSRTPASAGNRKTWTWSGWAKLSSSSLILLSEYEDTNNRLYLGWGGSNQFDLFGRNSGTIVINTVANAVFRDFSAWYHIVCVLDTTQATSTDRVKLYVNNVLQSLTNTTLPSQNTDLAINKATTHYIGSRNSVDTFGNGYLTEINFIDGQALTPSSFGEFNSDTGVWQPIKYTGTYGTNGFYLNFSDNASTTTLGDDFSGNNNDWTTNNFSVTAGAGNDSLVDSPTRYGTDTGAGGEVRGNYCTLNPAIQPKISGSGSLTISNGGLTLTRGGGNGWGIAGGTTPILSGSGKWYYELAVTTSGAGADAVIGFHKFIKGTFPDALLGYTDGPDPDGYGYAMSGSKFNNGISAYGASWTSGDVIGCAIDASGATSSITFYKNGVSQGVAFSGLSGNFIAAVSCSGNTINLNFGQRPFAYTAPSGFKALVTTNLPTPTIEDGGDYFNAILYTGTGASNARTGVGFQPDLVWIKERSGAADHALYDAVRGVQQQLESNTTTDETTESTGLTAFGSDGFTVGSLSQVNTNNDTYVAWNWKESTTSKFDIVTYTGNGSARTISHNLGVVPNMIIVKARTTASTDQGWPVYHSANTAAPETDYLLLNTDAATADLDTVWNDTAPTSSVFSVGTNALVNANNDTYVAYLFANVAGYSAFGSYTGNGNADGPFVYTGFRPAFVMIKRADNIADWVIIDDERSAYNVANLYLRPNDSASEVTSDRLDFISNGFKLRTTGANVNFSGDTYIYMAFAENPFSIALAR